MEAGMSRWPGAATWLAAQVVSLVFLAGCLFAQGAVAAQPASAEPADPEAKAAVQFMRAVMEQVNPSLSIEDAYCAAALPWAIYSRAAESELDWRQVFVLAWQESRFDCHAKSRQDRGGAYGPFQIRRVWDSIVGDPRYRYYDPELAADRVTRILRYYQETDRYALLHARGFRFPLLCLFNAGEAKHINMDYCKAVGRKVDSVRKGWAEFKEGKLIAVSGN
jgi:hypothetical protein